MKFDTPDSLSTMAMESHCAAQTLSGCKFIERLRPWRELLVGMAKANGFSLVDTVFSLLKDLERAHELNGGAAMWLLAAFAEEAMQRVAIERGAEG